MGTTGRLGIAGLVAVGIILLTGCAGNGRYDGPSYEDQPGPEQYLEEDYSDSNDQPQEPPARFTDPSFSRWVCSYDPTMNEDWHDDVLCRNGTQYDRPYLRDWDDFVEYPELMQSASEYEAQLNATQ